MSRGRSPLRRLVSLALHAVRRRVRGPRGPRRPPTSDALGRRGEREAAKALRKLGYRILARRLRTRGGEVDLVAAEGDTLVLVEVKASLAPEDGPVRAPSERVDRRKRRRLAGASSALRGGALGGRPHRIDVVAVVFRGGRAEVSVLRGAVRAARASGTSDGA